MTTLLQKLEANYQAVKANTSTDAFEAVKSIKPYKISSLPIKQAGKNLIQMKFLKQEGELWTNEQIRMYAAGVQRHLVQSDPFWQQGYRLEMQVNNLYDESIAWQAGKWRDFGSEVNFYDFNSQYVVDNVRLQDTFSRFNLLIKVVPTAGGCCSEAQAKYNHCLFDSLARALNYKMLKPIVNASALKKTVGVSLRDKVDVDDIPKIEQACDGKLAISVNGDVKRKSPVQNPQFKVTVTLRNGHFFWEATNHKLDAELIRTYIAVNKATETMVVCKKHRLMYDGNKVIKMTSNNMKMMGIFGSKHCHSTTIYHNVKLFDIDPKKQKKELKKEYRKLRTIKDELYAIHQRLPKSSQKKPQIDLMRGNTPKVHALYVFACFTDHMKHRFKPLDVYEAIWIKKASHGGLQYGEPGVYPNAFSYDLNKMYSYLLTGNSKYHGNKDKWSRFCGFPCEEGTYLTLDKVEPPFKFGLYHCKIHIPKNHKLFRLKGTDHYTHYDLQTAHELGLTIEMIQDGHANALTYEWSQIVNAERLFQPFFDYMKLFLEHTDCKKTKKYLKLVMNSLWGGLCQKNTRWLNINEENPLDMDMYEIQQLEPESNKEQDNERYRAKVEHISHLFKTPYARLSPFITSCGRRCMYLHLRNVEQYVKRIHTDGFISSRKLKLQFGDEWGQWKVEKQGDCKVIHVNSQEWS